MIYGVLVRICDKALELAHLRRAAVASAPSAPAGRHCTAPLQSK